MGEGCVTLKLKVYFVVVYNIANGSISYLPNMICLKPNPIVFAVSESIYVLANPSDINVPDPAFEVFNLSTTENDWEELSPSPFFDRGSEYCNTSRENMVVLSLIGPYVSPLLKPPSNLIFDKKIWEPCMLFQGPDPWTLVDDDGWTPSTPCGPPFHFEGRAVLFGNDTLICMSPNNVVISYKMVGDKIVKSQSFRSQGLRGPQASSFIARVGDGGLFCMFVMQDVDYDTYFSTVRLFCEALSSD